MTYQRSTGVKELLFLRAKFNDLVDSLVDAEIELPSASDPSAYFPPLRPELPKIIALCEQIQALLGGPTNTLNQAFLFHISSCLRVAIEARVEETLREAAEQGKTALHVKVIAKSSTVCPEKLARVLRLLAARHIFREVGLDTFARNRCSSALDTGKSVSELKAYPDLAYVDTSGFAALLAHTADECFKASAYLSEAVLSPATAYSYDIRAAPFGIAYGGGATIFEHFSRKRNAHLLARFSSAIKFAGKAFSGGEDSILSGFPFSNLRDGAIIVDVGAGIGQVALTISEAHPQIRVVVQDLSDVIREARPYWKSSAPRDIESGRVTLMEYDFFTEQPVKRADVYILRAIVHDWADRDAVRILERLSEAASEKTSLIVVEQSYNYLHSPNPFPAPSLLPYFMDLQLMVAVNALERTQPQYETLAIQAGWELVKVWKTGLDPREGRGGEGDRGHRQEGPYRHYEFKLSSERVRLNRKRDEKNLKLKGGGGIAPHATTPPTTTTTATTRTTDGYSYGIDKKELVRAMKATGLAGIERTGGSTSSSVSSSSSGYKESL